MPRLIVIKGTDEGKQFPLTGDLLPVGRDSSSRIRLTDTEASRRHAEFVRTAEGYRVRDVGSANGTLVNNQSIRDVLLQPGDHIQIGQTVMVYTPEGIDPLPRDASLADRINLITRQDADLASAIVQSIADTEGSRILANPQRAESPWLKNALANLSVLYEVTHSISAITDLDQLLERIMDLVFRTLDADRGCIMLIRGLHTLGHLGQTEPGTQTTERDDESTNETRPPVQSVQSVQSSQPAQSASSIQPSQSAQFDPKAVRWRGRRPAPDEKLPVSRTIMDYVLSEKKGILVNDAASDERFQTAQSIVRSSVREVICVPMRGRHHTLGVLYLDTTTPMNRLAAEGITSRFGRDHLNLAGAIAHQAALAVETTRYYQAMVHAERLAAIGQTIATLSHHIKNILTGLRAASDIVEMGIQERDEALFQEGWKKVQRNQGRISDLVMDMLSYSKEREPSVEPTDLNILVADVLELVQAQCSERGVQIRTKLDKSLCAVPLDFDGIHRALLNLVTNALDAVEGVEKPQILVGTLREANGDWVQIVVKDNGPGFLPERKNEIFRPFVSTKGSRGTGLGLPVSRKILREHGGDVLVQSELGKGSQFSLRLPVRSPLLADPHGTQMNIPSIRNPEQPEQEG